MPGLLVPLPLPLPLPLPQLKHSPALPSRALGQVELLEAALPLSHAGITVGGPKGDESVVVAALRPPALQSPRRTLCTHIALRFLPWRHVPAKGCTDRLGAQDILAQEQGSQVSPWTAVALPGRAPLETIQQWPNDC